MKLRLLFSIVIGAIPIVLALGIFNTVDCDIVNGVMHDHCLQYHPVILYALVPASPIVGYLMFWLTKPENQIASQEVEK